MNELHGVENGYWSRSSRGVRFCQVGALSNISNTNLASSPIYLHPSFNGDLAPLRAPDRPHLDVLGRSFTENDAMVAWTYVDRVFRHQ